MTKLRLGVIATYEGEVLRPGITLPSGRFYPKEAVEAEVERLQNKIQARGFFGRFCPKNLDGASTTVSEVSHVVTSLSIVDDVLRASLDILDTDGGREFKDSLDDLGPNWEDAYRLTPRGQGTTERMNDFSRYMKVSEYRILEIMVREKHDDE